MLRNGWSAGQMLRGRATMLRDDEHARGERGMLRYQGRGEAISDPVIERHAYTDTDLSLFTSLGNGDITGTAFEVKGADGVALVPETGQQFDLSELEPQNPYTATLSKVVNYVTYSAEYIFDVLFASEVVITIGARTSASVDINVALARTLIQPVTSLTWLGYENGTLSGFDPDTDTLVSGDEDELGTPTESFSFTIGNLTAGRAYHMALTLRLGYDRSVTVPIDAFATLSTGSIDLTGYSYVDNQVTLLYTDTVSSGPVEFSLAGLTNFSGVFTLPSGAGSELTASVTKDFLDETYSDTLAIQVVRPANVSLAVVTAAVTRTSITLDVSFTGLASLDTPIAQVEVRAYASTSSVTYNPASTPVTITDTTSRPAPTAFELTVGGLAPWYATTPIYQHCVVTITLGAVGVLTLPVVVTQSLSSATPPDPATLTLTGASDTTLSFDLTVGSYNDGTSGTATLQYKLASSATYLDWSALTGADTQATIIGLQSNANYHVRVRKEYMLDGVAGAPVFTELLTPQTTGTGLVLNYEMSTASVDDVVVGGAANALESASGKPIGFVTHPVIPSQTVLYMDRDGSDEFDFTSEFMVSNTTRVPKANFSIQLRYYFVADGVGDNFDTRLRLLYYEGASSSFDFWLNGKSDTLYRKVLMDGVEILRGSVGWNTAWDLHTTGHKVISIVVDTAGGEIRVYAKDQLVNTVTGIGDFAAGIAGSAAPPLKFRNLNVDNDTPPGGKVYVESIKVYDRVLAGVDLL
jgi:hypothetical protein